MKKSIHYIKVLFCTLLLIVCQVSLAEDADQEQSVTTDVRVIIDISGSMKKNDPDNLRVPALKLLIGLLPEGVKAGVWTFGTKVKPLVKHGIVNKKWKKKANKAVKKISSRDMFTNVESALKVVTKDWDSDTKSKKNIIFLTDGMVDVSKKKEKSEASRQRILNEVLSELQSKGATVHTVSLSENADQEIMEALAAGTDGWSEQVNSADQLQRVFLHMFEKSTPRDTVPLKDNQFTIDKMIEEFTLLVFRNKDIKKSTVTTPKGEKFNQGNAPKNVAWLEEDGYDLVTITKPTAGIWKIDAEIDPDNRVMVVTKLKLHTSGFPNSVFDGEEHDYKIWLTAAGKTIDKEAFYNLIDVKVVQSSAGEIIEVWDLKDRDDNHKFAMKLGDTFNDSQLELSVIVDGKTFKREKKQTINVYQQIVEVETKEAGSAGGNANAHVIRVIPDIGLVDEKSLEIVATITTPDGKETKIPATKAMVGSNWLVNIMDPQKGQYSVTMEVKAKTKNAREITVHTDLVTVGEAVVEKGETNDEEVTEESESVEEEPEETDWVRIGIILLVSNVVLFGLIGGGWMYMKKRKKNAPEPGDDL